MTVLWLSVAVLFSFVAVLFSSVAVLFSSVDYGSLSGDVRRCLLGPKMRRLKIRTPEEAAKMGRRVSSPKNLVHLCCKVRCAVPSKMVAGEFRKRVHIKSS